MTGPTPGAGWFPDPTDSAAGRLRWWDGVAWTDHYAPAYATTAATPPAPRRSSAPLIAGLVGAVLLIVVVVAAAAVVIAREADEPATATTTEPIANGTLVTADGASLVLPKGWTNVPLGSGDLEGFLREAAKANPAMAATLEESIAVLEERNLAMFAVQPSTSTRAFATNANLLVVPRDDVSIGAVAASQVVQLERSGATDVVPSRFLIQGREAARAEYTLELNSPNGPVTLRGIQFVAVGEENIAILTVSATSNEAEADADVMARSIVIE